jgi:hypothetical protein
MSSSKPIRPNSNWEKLIYVDEARGPCVDLIVDTVKLAYSIKNTRG